MGNGIGGVEMRHRILFMVLLMLVIPSQISLDVDAQTSGRSCASSPPSGSNVDHIEITPSGPISIPADVNLDMTAKAYDSSGSEIGSVQFSWSATSGTVQNFGSGSARWLPTTMGSQTVTVCTGTIESHLSVQVLHGTALSLDLVPEFENITADQTISLSPYLIDTHGNTWIPNVPFADWTLPQGTSIDLPNDGTSPTFTPGPTGPMTVEVSWEDWTASTTINVSFGAPNTLQIVHNSDTNSHNHVLGSSGEALELCAHLVDQKGNAWVVNASWFSPGDLAQPFLSSNDGNCIDFESETIGDWVVYAEDPHTGITSGVVINVSAGSIAQVKLDALPSEHNIGDSYPLSAVALDSAGNIVEVSEWSWSVISGPSGNAIVSSNGVMYFEPNLAGQHRIQAIATGSIIPGIIDVEVHPGTPVSLEIEILDEDVAEEMSLVTGSEIEIQIYGVDINGNKNPVNVENWTIEYDYGEIVESSTTTGRYMFTADGIGFTSIHAKTGDAEGSIIVEILAGELAYLEVIIPSDGLQGRSTTFQIIGYDISGNEVTISHPCAVEIITDIGKAKCGDDGWTLELDEPGENTVYARLGNADGSAFIDVEETWFGWGDNTEVIIAGSLLIVAVISVVLVFLFRHLGTRIEEEIELISEESEGVTESNTTQPAQLQLTTGLPPVVAPGFVPPMVAGHIPTPSIAQVTPAPVHPVTQAPSMITPATVNPQPPPTQQQFTDPFAVFVSTPEEVEPEPQISQNTVQVDHFDPESPTPHTVVEKPQEEIEMVQDDTWGDMSESWGDGSETVSTAAAEFAQIQHENRRGDGPRINSEDSLRPLPGTEKGSDGWYFDVEGRPTHWTHSDENGWVQE